MPRREPREPSVTDSAQALASIRAEVVRIRSTLVRLEEHLDALEAAPQHAMDGPRERPERYMRVLLIDTVALGGPPGR